MPSFFFVANEISVKKDQRKFNGCFSVLFIENLKKKQCFTVNKSGDYLLNNMSNEREMLQKSAVQDVKFSNFRLIIIIFSCTLINCGCGHTLALAAIFRLIVSNTE